MSPVCRTLKNVGSPRMIVDVPEIYGCMADGATPVEALENVETIQRRKAVCSMHRVNKEVYKPTV